MNMNEGFYLDSAVDMLIHFRGLIGNGLITELTSVYALRVVFPEVWREAVRRGFIMRID
jgi:hypothetical protein